MPNNLTTENRIELRRSGQIWEAYFSGPHSLGVVELFGDPAIPTAWSHRASGKVVREHVERLNPGVLVILAKEEN